MTPKMPKEYFELRREQILMAAWGCFAEKGFRETTMRDISQSLGLSIGAVYRYFKGKDEILEALQAISTENNQQLLAAMDQKETAREAIMYLFNAMFKECSVPDLMVSVRGNSIMLLEALKHRNISDLFQPQYQHLMENVSRIMAAGKTKGEFDSDLDPDAFARFFYALFTGMQIQFALIDGLDVTSAIEGIERILFSEVMRDESKGVEND
ncbi:MAG: TetR/AcrR family transcriptional regulator [Candidatus Neomarinimicrobiota bacterium]